jgi:hypothetical protein
MNSSQKEIQMSNKCMKYSTFLALEEIQSKWYGDSISIHSVWQLLREQTATNACEDTGESSNTMEISMGIHWKIKIKLQYDSCILFLSMYLKVCKSTYNGDICIPCI